MRFVSSSVRDTSSSTAARDVTSVGRGEGSASARPASRRRCARPRRPNGTRERRSPPRARTRGRSRGRCRARRPSRSRSALPECGGTRRKVNRPLQSRHETPSRVRAPPRRGPRGPAARHEARVPTRHMPAPVPIVVATPPSYAEAPDRRYPVLYFLHDGQGDETVLFRHGVIDALDDGDAGGTPPRDDRRLPARGRDVVDRRAGRGAPDGLVPLGGSRSVRRPDVPYPGRARRPARRGHLDGRLRRPALGARASGSLRGRRRPLPGDPAALRALRRRAPVLPPAVARGRVRRRPGRERPEEERPLPDAPRRRVPGGTGAVPPRALRDRGQVPPRGDHRASSTASRRRVGLAHEVRLETGVHDWPYWRRVLPDFVASLAARLAPRDAP